MRNAAFIAAQVAALAGLGLTAGSHQAGAVALGGTQATFAWAPASGPVHGYGVYVSRDGNPDPSLEAYVLDTQATIQGGYGETLVVQVAAFDAEKKRGPLSAVSVPVEFTSSQGSPGIAMEPIADAASVLYVETFEGYGDGEDPVGWLDTARWNSMDEDPTLFETFALTDGTTAFGTSSRDVNVHSHLGLGESTDWSGYEFSGLLSISHPRAGIGVTVYSDYPVTDAYYRIRRYDNGSFHLSPHAAAEASCQGTTDSGVVPSTGLWYRFRFRAMEEGPGTRLRAKVWPSTDAEPAGWQIDCLEPDASFSAGTPGVWALGHGLKLWDDLQVVAIGDSGDAGPPDPAPGPQSAQYAESFEGYQDGDDPVGWFDTRANNSLAEDPALFEAIELTDGTKVFGTASELTNLHSHLLLGDSVDWSSYELSGAMAVEKRFGGIGVTVYSDFPFSDQYYRLRHYSSGAFELSSHGTATCSGTTSTGVVPWGGAWYDFRFQAFPEGSGTRLRSKVWVSGSAEPAGWQIDCFDAAASRTHGAPGVWSMGQGMKYWDDLQVSPITPGG